jgi:hypothetical protein
MPDNSRLNARTALCGREISQWVIVESDPLYAIYRPMINAFALAFERGLSLMAFSGTAESETRVPLIGWLWITGCWAHWR